MNITRQQYLQNPCGTSSLPYWKAVSMAVPENMLIQHDRAFCGACLAELDEDVGEGILEWIQVSPAYRGHGLGTYVVTELLNRMSSKARFATVSGQVNNPSNPEGLYRKCGFQGNDVWHIMRMPMDTPS